MWKLSKLGFTNAVFRSERFVRALSALAVAIGAIPGVGVQPEEQIVKEALESVGHRPLVVSESPVDGIYEVETAAGATMYVSGDGEHVLVGDLLKIRNGQIENLTAKRLDQKRKALLDELEIEDLVVFSPEGTAEHTVYVFTDVDCSYCRILHQNIDGYLSKGIEIRYVAFPRAGTRSETYDKMVSAWCGEDRNALLTTLKNGNAIEKKICPNPVANHYDLGQRMKITGTPTIIVARDGSSIPGYLPPDQLLQSLSQRDD